LDAPCSQAFLFAGPTGVGKTSAALALANDLGVNKDWGLMEINSGRTDGDAVERALTMLRHACPAGSGWKLVLIDESDLMTPKAAHLWLSALEDLPPKSIVVFTTNRLEFFADRFVDRCETIVFQSDADLLRQDAQSLVNRVWTTETGRTDTPSITEIANLMDKHNQISFRRAVAALDPMIRQARRDASLSHASPTPTSPTLSFPDNADDAPRIDLDGLMSQDDDWIDFPRRTTATKVAKPGKTAARPAKSKPVPTPARKTIPANAPHDSTDLASIDAELAEIDREYEETGRRLILLDARKRRLVSERKAITKRAR
jgi:hypothetical protein